MHSGEFKINLKKGKQIVMIHIEFDYPKSKIQNLEINKFPLIFDLGINLYNCSNNQQSSQPAVEYKEFSTIINNLQLLTQNSLGIDQKLQQIIQSSAQSHLPVTTTLLENNMMIDQKLQQIISNLQTKEQVVEFKDYHTIINSIQVLTQNTQIVDQKLQQILYGSQKKGELGQNLLINVLQKRLYDYNIEDTAKQSHCGDIHISKENFKLMFEVKNYSTGSVPQSEVAKFKSDIQQLTEFDAYIFISINTKISAQPQLVVNRLNNKFVIYLAEFDINEPDIIIIMVQLLHQLKSAHNSTDSGQQVNYYQILIEAFQQHQMTISKKMLQLRRSLQKSIDHTIQIQTFQQQFVDQCMQQYQINQQMPLKVKF